MSDKFTKEYFIDKFTAIPEELWCVYLFNFGDKSCAMGHCGVGRDGEGWLRGEPIPEASRLYLLLKLVGLDVFNINDGRDGRFPQATPKQRILAALRSL